MLIAQLNALEDVEPHSAAVNMAIDELLLENLASPTLRIYRWAEPAISFGYFTPFEEVEDLWPGLQLVRRWTGGGVVPHGRDFTYTLLCPLGAPLTSLPPLESYRVIHEAVAFAIASHRADVVLAGPPSPKISHACFENAAQFDILAGTEKIAGAAQRRTRHGLLHQGSIQLEALDSAFGRTLADALSGDVKWAKLPPDLLPLAERLAASRYGTQAWLRRF